MAWTRNLWNNLKTQPEIWLFYAFILTSPLSIRKVFFHYPLFGELNEYAGAYLYLSDIFFGLTLGVWVLSILYNKLFNTSNYTLRPVSRGTIVNFILLPTALVLWSFITILWSKQAEIATYRSFKLFEFYLLYLFLVLHPRCSTVVKIFHPSTNVPRETSYGSGMEQLKKMVPNFLRNFFRLIIFVGAVNALIGILQVILQHSVGLFWLKESLINPELPGVAKIVLNGSKYIRAYGLFPHPNILGGFLFLSLMLTLAYRQLFHVKQLLPSCTTNCAEWKNGLCKIYSTSKTFSLGRGYSAPAWSVGRWNKLCWTGQYMTTFILAIQIVAGILTFSKSAILGFILALAYAYRHQIRKMFHVEHFSLFLANVLKKTILIVIFTGLVAYLIYPDFRPMFINSLVERLVYIQISLSMISGNFLAGIGSGQFILEMQQYLSQALLPWQLQPVHNVFLLIWSELGLIGFSLSAWFIWTLLHPSADVPHGTLTGTSMKNESLVLGIKNVSRGTTGFKIDTSTIFKALLIGFFVIALFDHYLWDIQQGQIMLWLTLGFLANSVLYA